MKKMFLVLAVLLLLPVSLFAKKTTYIATNHRFNYVKIEEVKPSVAEARGITHPAEFNEEQIRAMLQSVKLSRRHLFNKEIDTQDAFNDSSINFLAPAFVKAFHEARPNDIIVFSYLIKDPIFILRNDRLNLGIAWVHENELHLKFSKLYAKVTGDTDARGHEAEAVARARGLRIDFDIQPGQQFGLDDPEELVVDITHDFGADVTKMAAEKPEETKKETKKKEKKEIAKAEEEVGQEANKGSDVKERLENLEQLKKDKLITNKEYKEKKKEILKDL